uniref:Uncharacterized protein n=1 Tax=Mustela putorius furo TaxID=9669 RepID=M3XPJ2_MUSPF
HHPVKWALGRPPPTPVSFSFCLFLTTVPSGVPRGHSSWLESPDHRSLTEYRCAGGKDKSNCGSAATNSPHAPAPQGHRLSSPQSEAPEIKATRTPSPSRALRVRPAPASLRCHLEIPASSTERVLHSVRVPESLKTYPNFGRRILFIYLRERQ